MQTITFMGEKLQVGVKHKWKIHIMYQEAKPVEKVQSLQILQNKVHTFKNLKKN